MSEQEIERASGSRGSPPAGTAGPVKIGRRGVFARAGSLAMAGGLFADYGGFFAILARYLYPPRPDRRAWLFVTDLDGLPAGQSMTFRLPSGARAAIVHQQAGLGSSDFLALSSTCPHLGCQVHWEAAREIFFCPCHNGAFDRQGRAIAGPPFEAGQSLPRYPLEVRGKLLFIETPVVEMASASAIEPEPASAEPSVRGALAASGGRAPCSDRSCRGDVPVWRS